MLVFKFCISNQKVSVTEELKIIAAVQAYHFTLIDIQAYHFTLIDNMCAVNKKRILKKIFNKYLIGTLVGLFCQLVLKHEHI